MIAQLGKIIFDGLKSFGSWSEDQEAVIVEHALIGRQPKLESTGLGLINLNLTIFLHADFCKPDEEISKLRTSMSTFEILPLLLGSGQYVGDFVIQQMSLERNQVFKDGVLFSASVSLALKEVPQIDKLSKQQKDAQDNAFANGDKKPATKSTRTNQLACNQRVTKVVQQIKSHAAVIDDISRKYTSQGIQNFQLQSEIKKVQSLLHDDLADIVRETNSCLADNKTFRDWMSPTYIAADSLLAKVTANAGSPFPDIPGEKTANDTFQIYVKNLVAAASSNIQKAATRNG